MPSTFDKYSNSVNKARKVLFEEFSFLVVKNKSAQGNSNAAYKYNWLTFSRARIHFNGHNVKSAERAHHIDLAQERSVHELLHTAQHTAYSRTKALILDEELDRPSLSLAWLRKIFVAGHNGHWIFIVDSATSAVLAVDGRSRTVRL